MGPDIAFILLALVGGAVALGVAIALLVMAVKITGGVIKGIFWLVAHLVRFVGGVRKDAIRFVGSIIALIVALPFSVFNVILGRWPSAERWGRALKRESMIGGYSIFSLLIRRPLQLFCLDGVLEGVERRLPNGEGTAPVTPSGGAVTASASRDPAVFEGYEIEGTLRPGGSGAKLYIAAPSKDQRRRLAGQPDKVVIKSFALEEGSSLPQIVRESRALDSARAMGLVLDHGLDERRFWYAMPYHAGENLAETTRLLHARSGRDGLEGDDLREALGHCADLVATLARYHEGGLWHKDVKPDNIIVHGGRAHLVDLGLVTPLRSAMTLTTHGTEYFRDPEMVRQALRGVRVHQVDGAKFDIYGAGAVLYFLLENTFPAHGGLSSFARRSPEAMRWIVRRAMADYHQRYGSSRAMLDDLNCVARAADPWSVRPVDLPSLRGADINQPFDGPAAGTPAFSVQSPRFEAQSARSDGRRFFGSAVLAGRPRLRVTSWWSGAYASPDVADRMRDAQAAAKAAQRVVKERRPRKMCTMPNRVGASVGITMVLLFTTLFTTLGSGMFKHKSRNSPPAMTLQDTIVQNSQPPKNLSAPAQGTKLILVNEHPGRGSQEVDELVNRIAGKWTERGFTIVTDDTDTTAKLEFALARMKTEVPGAKEDFEATLTSAGYWAAIAVDAPAGDGPPKERLRAQALGDNAVKAIADAKAQTQAESKSKKSKRTKPKTDDAQPQPVSYSSSRPMHWGWRMAG